MAVLSRDDPFDRQTAALRSGLSGADTATYAAILATTGLRLYGRDTVYIQGRFSSAGASAVVKLIYVWNDGVNNYAKGESPELTLDATTNVDGGGKYASTTLGVGGQGSYSVYIQLVSITAGTVDLWVGSKKE